MADQKVADKDITVENDAGQTVVVVAEGQPIPDNLNELKDQLSQGADPAPRTEDKAARSSKDK